MKSGMTILVTRVARDPIATRAFRRRQMAHA
jgi:hypothetical protein